MPNNEDDIHQDAGQDLAISQRGTGGLPCAPDAPQRHENAWQRFCRSFFVRAHDKEHTVEFCTVNSHCRALHQRTHGELCLPCVTGRSTAKKATDGAGAKQCVTAFAVRRQKNARQSCRMDLPGPTASVGDRTDYSVGPWDYPTCAARHLMA
jgi:hypothetical protein